MHETNAKAKMILDRSLKVREKGFLSMTTTPTMLDNQLPNGQHKSISRKNNFSFSFHLPTEFYPILPLIANIHPASSTHSAASMQFSLSPMQSSSILPQNKHNANKKRNNHYKEKLFRHCSLLASESDSSFTDRRCVPGGLSNDKNWLPDVIAIQSACPINSFV